MASQRFEIDSDRAPGQPEPMAASAGLPLVLCIGVISLLPFVNKAFHVDDTLFLFAARNIEAQPLNFYGFPVNWNFSSEPMAEVTKNPPLAAYYIALVGLLAGWQEWSLHLAFMVPALFVLWGTYRLAERMSLRPAVAALITLFTPAFLVSSTSVMSDVMMLSFWVWAVVYWCRGLTRRHLGLLVLAGLLAALALLTKYFAVCLVPLLAAYGLARRRRLGWWVLPLGIPLLVLVLYGLYTRKLYGQDLFLAAVIYPSHMPSEWTFTVSLFPIFVMTLAYLGGCLASAFFFFPYVFSGRTLVWLLLGGIALGVILRWLGALGSMPLVTPDSVAGGRPTRWGALVQATVMATAGGGILFLGLRDGWVQRDADSLLLILWLVGTAAFAGWLNWTINARTILPAAPAVGILVTRALAYGPARCWRLPAWTLAVPLLPAAALSLLVAYADQSLANSARDAAASISRRFAGDPAHHWFEGHWGFQYYMEQHGYAILDSHAMQAQKKDLLAVPRNNYGYAPLPEGSLIPIADPKVYRPPVCRFLSTSNAWTHAGFYSGTTGALPYVFGSVPPEEYFIYRFARDVKGPLPFPPAGQPWPNPLLRR